MTQTKSASTEIIPLGVILVEIMRLTDEKRMAWPPAFNQVEDLYAC